MKTLLAIFLACCSMTALAQQHLVPDGNGGWVLQNGDAMGFQGNLGVGAGMIQGMQILQYQQQIENQRIQNELLRQKLQQDQAARQSSQQGAAITPEFQNWMNDNPWYGRDKAKTEFALLYAKQLRQEHPSDLFGRPFFDVVSAHVNEAFK